MIRFDEYDEERVRIRHRALLKSTPSRFEVSVPLRPICLSRFRLQSCRHPYQYRLRTGAEDDILIAGRIVDRGMVPSNTFSERQPSHKATLYCTNCNHSSRINGDWIIEVHTNRLDYECPECGTTIDSRRDGTALTAQSGGVLRPDTTD